MLYRGIISFDIIIDIGGTSYIGNLWECYDNLYSFIKKDGLIFHISPEKNSKWHPKEFIDKQHIEKISKQFKAIIKDMQIISGQFGNLIAACLIKK